MAKCPKCSSRKGKRPCPALGADICARCCGEHRLVSIPCPRDCPYLVSEFYQQRRRQERATSRGKRFVDNLKELFPQNERRRFAFNLQADIYYYMRRYGVLEDAEVLQGLEEIKKPKSRVIMPAGVLHPLSIFLREQLENAERYPLGPSFTERDCASCLEALCVHLRSFPQDGARHYHEEIEGFFGALDFEADLDYEPHRSAASEEAQKALRRTPGGLILPSS